MWITLNMIFERQNYIVKTMLFFRIISNNFYALHRKISYIIGHFLIAKRLLTLTARSPTNNCAAHFRNSFPIDFVSTTLGEKDAMLLGVVE
jgi:hypothetical protein